MAAAAAPLIEGALARLLVALGIGVVADGATKEVLKRKEEADNARTAPIAKTEAQTKTKEKCKDCTPDKGALVTRNWNMSEVSRAYQARITGFAPFTEWNFAGVDFDGFQSAPCLLLEAKAKYDQFFDDFGPFEWWKGDQPLMAEATKQALVAKPMPPVQLHWHFMEPHSYAYFTRIFAAMRLTIETHYTP